MIVKFILPIKFEELNFKAAELQNKLNEINNHFTDIFTSYAGQYKYKISETGRFELIGDFLFKLSISFDDETTFSVVNQAISNIVDDFDSYLEKTSEIDFNLNEGNFNVEFKFYGK